jgi:hypothetical protein
MSHRSSAMASNSCSTAITSFIFSLMLSPPFGGIPQAAHPERSGGLSGIIIQTIDKISASADGKLRGMGHKSDIIGGRKDRLGEVKRVFLGLPKRGCRPHIGLTPFCRISSA